MGQVCRPPTELRSVTVFLSMDVRQLELFLAVMEYGSVTKAAERVYLSPGAVSL
jgi:hypothetical protein